MARNSLTLTMENQSIEDHLVTLFEKLETIRETKETTNALSKYHRQPIQIEIRTLEFWRSIISECLATFFFVFIVSGAGLNYLNKGTEGVPNDMVLATALATGFSMAILNQCFGKISGPFLSHLLTRKERKKTVNPPSVFAFCHRALIS